MKTLIKAITLGLGMGVITISCEPEQKVQPKGSHPDTGLEVMHARPTPECTGMHFTGFADASGNTVGGYPWPTAYGQVELANDPDNIFIICSAGGGWVITSAGINVVTNKGMIRPASTAQMATATSNTEWAFVYELNPAPQGWQAKIPMDKSADPCVDIAMHAMLAQVSLAGNLFNQTEVWIQGESTVNGKKAYDFCFVPCGGTEPPACVIPTNLTLQSLQTISTYDCTTGSGQRKVKVCHVPPGSPENMQEICIPIANSDAHIISMKPIDKPCMGHHSGCHMGPCDPCGPGSTLKQSVNIPVVTEYGTKYACPGN